MRILPLLGLIAYSLPAAILSSSNGGHLAGGSVTVTWQDSSTSTLAIPVPASGFEDSAIINNGLFSFRIDNETLTNDWRLTNNRAGFSIIGFQINLLGSIAVFDNGVAPAAPGSNTNVPSYYGGTDGVRSATTEPIGISSYAFTNQYLGDGGQNMFHQLSVTLSSALAENTTYVFNADTDRYTSTAIPEPSTWMTTLAAASALGLLRLRRRS